MDKKVIMMLLLSILGVTGGSIGIHHVNKADKPANKKIKIFILATLVVVSLISLITAGLQMKTALSSKATSVAAGKLKKITPTNVIDKIEPPNAVPSTNVNAPVVTNNA
jgi:hypothetical protein